MKVFVASLSTETNSFAPAPTGLAGFDIERHQRLEDMPDEDLWRRSIESLCATGGHEVALGLFAFAQPSGPTVRSAYESLRDEILEDLRAAMPVDAVVLPLHGAMVADGYPDCEGDLIARVRALVGPEVAIGVELDLHCHYTELMQQNADIIVAYKEYPHTDVHERFVETWQLTLAKARGEIQPTTAVVDCRMVSFWHTTREPMRSFVAGMQALEQRADVLTVSFGQGFPYGDVPEAGAKIWVSTDNDPALAAQLCEELRQQIWAMREATRPTELDLDTALARLRAHRGAKPLLIADVADNAGGGAASDSNFILQGLVDQGIGNVALGPYWDLGAIAICREAGEGARVQLRVGGKCGPASGLPVDLSVTVRRILPDFVQEVPGTFASDCGDTVWVSTDTGLDLILISRRQQAYAKNLFQDPGVELESKAGIVVKSTQHFHADYAPLADEVLYVNTPGLLRTDFENLPYQHRNTHYWPRVADPFQEAPA